MKKISYDCIYKCHDSGSFENVGTNCLEINTLFFVSILGALGFKEDFKTLIQNGFTRKYIFKASGDNADDQSDKSDDCILDCVEDPYIFKRGHAFLLDD